MTNKSFEEICSGDCDADVHIKFSCSVSNFLDCADTLGNELLGRLNNYVHLVLTDFDANNEDVNRIFVYHYGSELECKIFDGLKAAGDCKVIYSK